MTQQQRNQIYANARTALSEELEELIGQRAIVQHRVEAIEKRIEDLNRAISKMEEKEKIDELSQTKA